MVCAGLESHDTKHKSVRDLTAPSGQNTLKGISQEKTFHATTARPFVSECLFTKALKKQRLKQSNNTDKTVP